METRVFIWSTPKSNVALRDTPSPLTHTKKTKDATDRFWLKSVENKNQKAMGHSEIVSARYLEHYGLETCWAIFGVMSRLPD